MKKLFAGAVFLTAWLPGWVFAQQPVIDIVYPREGSTITVRDSTFILGNVSPPDASFEINGVPVKLHPNGAFLAFLPITATNRDTAFVFECTAKKSGEYVRTKRRVGLPGILLPLDSKTAALDPGYLFPSGDLWLQPGDQVNLVARGTPGCQVRYSVLGSDGDTLFQDLPMVEDQAGVSDYYAEAVFGQNHPRKKTASPGIYSATFQIPHTAHFEKGTFVFRIEDDRGGTAEAAAPGHVFLLNSPSPLIAELTGDRNIARPDPGRAYLLFLPKDVRTTVTAKKHGYARLRISRNQEVWLPESNLNYLAAGTPVPASRVTVVRHKRIGHKSRIQLTMSEKLPFEVIHSPEEYEIVLRVFGAYSDTDWIRMDESDQDIRSIRWAQPEPGVYELTVKTKTRQLWGYDVRYDGTNLVFELTHRKKNKVRFKDLRICLDPGHSAAPGSTGPTRFLEKEANLLIALELKRLLEKKGAEVVLTRSDNEIDLDLYERRQIAIDKNCDLFISIHNNALPDGINPFLNNGTSVIFYHAQAGALAKTILDRMVDKTGLPSYGLFNGNIAVCRMPQMPAVLVECAFQMIPAHEALLKTKDFREKCAKGILEGIDDFLDLVNDEKD